MLACEPKLAPNRPDCRAHTVIMSVVAALHLNVRALCRDMLSLAGCLAATRRLQCQASLYVH